LELLTRPLRLFRHHRSREESTMSIPEIACSLSIIFLSAFVLFA
jgi:hypothetical protein